MANLSPSGNGGVSFVIVMNATYACTWAFWRIFSRLPCSRIGASIMEIWFQRQPRCMAARDHAFAPHLQLFRTEVLRGLDCVGLILTQQDALSASFWPWAPVSANWLLHPVRETRNTCKTGSFFSPFFSTHMMAQTCVLFFQFGHQRNLNRPDISNDTSAVIGRRDCWQIQQQRWTKM
jgi:hypothetical protein